MRLIIAPIITIITIICFSITLGGCEYRYRYPCQDPNNWNKLECNNEICEADGSCTKNTLGPNLNTNIKEQIDEESPIEETVESPTDEISSDTTCKPVSSERKTIGHKPSKEGVMDLNNDENEMPAHTPPSMNEEEPLSMNTVVDTAAHNAATK